MSKKASGKKKSAPKRLIASNKKAFHEYHVVEQFRAGIVLTGTEIKSLRAGKVSMGQCFCRIHQGEVFLYNLHISPYDEGSYNNHEPARTRKLLLQRKEINKLVGKVKESGFTLMPLSLVFDRCWVKVELGLCKGKKLHDKRETLKAKDNKREIDRARKRLV